jgi:CheY-like chemotaxis protein
MVIDDAADQVFLMKRLVEMVHPEIEFLSASHPDEALEILTRHGGTLPQVILLDLKLPGKTGIEFLRELKQSATLKKISICIFSNGDFEVDVREAYEAGASFYFKKPLGLAKLRKFVENFTGLYFKFATFA